MKLFNSLRRKKIRIGVYTICRNESAHVRQWVESMWCRGKGADRAYVLDTGSLDDTIEVFEKTLKKLKIPSNWLKIKSVNYENFRFDVARNDNLDMIKEDENWLDALVSVDLDETMIADFWKDLRAQVQAHPTFERIYYMYAWNHNENGDPKRTFWYDKVHPVKGIKWRYPVHEELVIDGNYEGKYYMNADKIYLHHWMDNEKSRAQYLPLLELRAEENPDDLYGLYYLLREYLAYPNKQLEALQLANTVYILSENQQYQVDEYQCIPFFILAIADIYNQYNLIDEARHFYQKAIRKAPNIRQPYLAFASSLAYSGHWMEALSVLADMKEKVPDKYPTWYECDYNWTWRPLQIEAVAYCQAKEYAEAKKVFEEAERLYLNTPTDIQEATVQGFYRDYEQLKNFLRK